MADELLSGGRNFVTDDVFPIRDMEEIPESGHRSYATKPVLKCYSESLLEGHVLWYGDHRRRD